MILRLTQKLNSKIKAGKLSELPLDENPFADWSVSLFEAGRTQYMLVSNTKSLYSTVMYGKGVTNENQFVQQTLDCIREFMDREGYSSIYEQLIAPSAGTVHLAKALNRAVTGSINELVEFAKRALNQGDVPTYRVGDDLNGFLLSAIALNPKIKYSKPRDAFRELIANVES